MDRHDTLLLVSEEPENRQILRSILEERFNLLEAVNVSQTVLLLGQNIRCVAAVLLDISTAGTAALAALNRETLMKEIPVIAFSAGASREELERAFDCGAADVIPLDYDGYAMLKRIGNIVELSLHKRNLEELVEEQANILRHSNDTMVDALSTIIEYRSVESGQHILRIRHFTKILLEEVARCCPEYGLTDQVIGIISSASALHDIGKIAIPDAILTKPGELTAEEREVMKTHAAIGCQILESVSEVGDQEYHRYAHNICHYHHERWDGGGYPEGLKGNDIPICAQVVGLADVYDALTSKRVYKEAYSFETAVNMILKGECGAFSPELIECFKRITDQYENLARSYADGLSPKSEDFDLTLPAPKEEYREDSMERTRSKYYALVHYINAFLMELNLDERLFHLIYNPYPEMIQFSELNNYADIERAVLELVVPEERERMEHFLRRELGQFVREGLRRVTYRFHFRSRLGAKGERFEVTLLRINPMDSDRNTLAVLARKVENGAGLEQRGVSMLSDTTFICRVDEYYTLVRLSDQIRLLAGYSREELREIFGNRLTEMVIPEDREKMRQTFREQLSRGGSVEAEFRVRRKDGKILWVLDRARLFTGEDGREYLNCFLTDISESKRDFDIMDEKLRRYEIILSQTENVLFEWDMAGDRITFSDTWEQIFGFRPNSDRISENMKNGSYFHPDDMPRIGDRLKAMRTGSDYEMLEVRIATTKGRYLWCRIRATALRDERGGLAKICGIIINIDAEKQAERALQDRAERDALTKLLNKHAGRKQAEEYFNQYPQGTCCALLIIDLDNFKQVNDVCGHLFGDNVLAKAAREIKKLFRTQDIVARIGGDEFMVLMRGVNDRALVESRCSRLLATFRSTFQDHHYNLQLACSIGIALAPEHGSSYYELFQRADQALYQAKDRGKGGYAFYNSKDAAFLTSKMRTVTVSNRIDSDEQPGMADGSIVQYAFQRLYGSRDVNEAIDNILNLIGRQLNVSRVYIFEDSPDHSTCSNTYEWCNAGISSQQKKLQELSYERDLPGFADNFDEQGIFHCPDIRVLPQSTYELVTGQGVKSMLLCAIRDKGVFSGFIGFDECTKHRIWTKEKIQLLTYFSEMLSVFLLKKRAQDKSNQRARDLSSILDSQNDWIYIIDPDNCQLKYLNAKAKTVAGDVKAGACCPRELREREGRCAICPVRRIRETKAESVEIRSDRMDRQIRTEAKLICWEGKPSCLMTCRELDEAK